MIFGYTNFHQPNLTMAASSDNVHGWAWSDTVGWISFNCTEGGPNQNDVCSTSSYGVNIDPSTGEMSGYAWSDNVGWISFKQADLAGCPSGSCIAQVDLKTGAVTGWARALNSIGTDYGWISLDCNNDSSCATSSYEVVIDKSTGHFSNYAWGGGPKDEAVIGWTSFNCSNDSSCSTSSYYVWTDIFGHPPYVENTDTTAPSDSDFCKNTASYRLSWIFRDSDAGAYENTYELKITNKNSGASGTYSPGSFPADTIVDGDSQSLSVPVRTSEDLSASPPQVTYGESYDWQVRVQDDTGLWSSWKSGPSFTVPDDYPDCSFTMTPTHPKIGEKVTFTDTSTAGAYSITLWQWDFGDGSSTSTTVAGASVTHIYTEVAKRTATLTITDSGNRSCSTSTTFTVLPGDPNYNEVIPR